MAGVLYLVVTWNADGIFGFPARTLQSLFDPDESSSGYRRVEDANLLLAVASDPLFGIGFGQRFSIVYPLPDISRFYEEYDLVPHNTLLFVWAFAGPIGFASFGALVAGVIGMAIRVARSSIDSRVTGFACIVGIVMVKSLAYVYADIGLREVRLLAEMGLLSGGLLAISRTHARQKNDEGESS
jgi:O-antigen ligase